MGCVRTALLGRSSSVQSSGSRSSNAYQFVTIRIAEVREVCAIRTHARRVLDRGAAVCDTGFVPCLGLRHVFHLKADRAAVGMARLAAVDGLGHHETAAIVRISESA